MSTYASLGVRSILLLGLLAALALPTPAQLTTATLVGDVGTTLTSTSSFPYRSVSKGDEVYFFADDGRHGSELWHTDGTAAGTSMLVDLCPGRCSFAGTLTRVGDLVFTYGNEGSGAALFVTDGTAAGTRLVRRFPGSDPVPGIDAVAFGGELWWSAYRSGGNYELWHSDGTAAGTSRLDCGADCIFMPQVLAPVGGALYFTARTPGTGQEMWRTDGVTAELAGEICPGDCTGVYGAVVAGGRLHVNGNDDDHGNEVWVIDGPRAAPRLVRDIFPGSLGSNPVIGRAIGNDAWFFAVATSGGPRSWYRTSNEDLVPATEVEPLGPGKSPNNLWAEGDRLFFMIYDSAGSTLWTARIGVEPAHQILGSVGWAEGIGSVGNLALLRVVTSGDYHQRPFTSDGTPAGTKLLADFFVGVGFAPLPGGRALLMLDDQVHGFEPWASDGTLAGTVLLGDLADVASSSPHQLTAAGADLFFTTGTGYFGTLFRATGSPPLATTAGVGGVRELAAAGSRVVAWRDDARLVGLDPVSGIQVLRSDRSDHLTTWGNLVAFGGSTAGAYGGQGLWVTDGTASGTRLVHDVDPGFSPYCPFECPVNDRQYPIGLTPVGSSLYFVGLPPTPIGEQLYRSDGTSTVALFPDSTGPGRYQRLDAVVPFAGGVAIGVHFAVGPPWVWQYELWVSGGTPETTRKVLTTLDELWPLGQGGNRLLFGRRSTTGGDQLWATDGTAAGTAALSPLGGDGARIVSRASTPPVHPDPLAPQSVVAGGQLYFSATDFAAGEELWVSDGTAAGTRRVADLRAGALGAHPTDLSSYRACALFAADDGTKGHELWASAGNGAFLVADVAPGADTSSPGPAALAGGFLDFAADDGEHGRELFAVPASTLDVACAKAAPPPPPPPPPEPEPPAGPWLSTPQVPGVRVKVVFGQGASAHVGSLSTCVVDTLCVVAAPGDRRELMLRFAVEPGNHLAAAIAKLSTAEAQVWVEQASTGRRRYYHLTSTPAGGHTLDGLLDRDAFQTAAVAGARATLEAPARGGSWLTPRGIPGYRFRVTWKDASGASRAGRAEGCMPGALCVSSAVKGRADLFVRLLDTLNDQGSLGEWPAIARLDDGAFEVWIQSTRTGETRHYTLPPVPPSSSDLDGVLDPTALR